METSEEKPIKILLPIDSYRKIMAYVDLVDTEITGFADCNFDQKRDAIVLGEVYLLKQDAQGTEVEMDEEAIANFNDQLMQKGVDQLPRCWWHSHVDMGAFFSGTDNDTIDNDLVNDSFMVSIVVNKRREMLATVVLWQPLHLRFDNVPISIMAEYVDIPEKLKKEVDRKVKDKKEIVVIHEQTDFTHPGTWRKKNGVYTPERTKWLHTNTLPRDPRRFVETIERYDLLPFYDEDTGKQYYQNEESGERWWDQYADYRYADQDEEEKALIE